MRIKDDSVEVAGIRPELMFGLYVADEVYRSVGVDMVVTSITDGRHSLTSLHYAGQAADIRIRNLPPNTSPATIAKEIKSRLNIDFDVVVEPDHIHLEYQPRRRTP